MVKYDSKTLRVDAIFFLNTEGKISVFEITRLRVDEALHQRTDEHWYSVIGKHEQSHSSRRTDIQGQFTVLKRCQSKFDNLPKSLMYGIPTYFNYFQSHVNIF